MIIIIHVYSILRIKQRKQKDVTCDNLMITIENTNIKMETKHVFMERKNGRKIDGTACTMHIDIRQSY